MKDLLGRIQKGRILDTLKEPYADDVVMEEPMYGQGVGLAATLDREWNFVNSVQDRRY
jgi:hypothetical protein